MCILILILITLPSYVAAVYEWRDHIKTKKDFLHDHLDVIKVMKQMHQHFFRIDDLIKNKQSLEGNQMCIFKCIGYISYNNKIIIINKYIISRFTNGPINIALKDIDEYKDVSGDHILWAHRALRRLQLFYAISASDMSAGRFNGKVIGDQMDGNS